MQNFSWMPALHGHAKLQAGTPGPESASSLAVALPNSAPHSLAAPWSIIGQGSLESYNGHVQPITFIDSDFHSSCARTALFAREATDSETGKPYQRKVDLRKFTGLNRGITD